MFRRCDFRKIELFGGGKKNTKVYKVEYLKTGQIFALKEVEAKSLDKLNEYKEEAVQLSKAQHHPNILQCYGYYFYSTTKNTFKLGIISEYINRELNLETIYRKREKQRLYWKEDKLLKIAYYLIDTFAYLEHIGICHRDIKPTNLFLLENYEIKVIDFGESIEFFDEDEEEGQMATIRGTPQYLSPILWEAHVILKAKEAEHNMFKSDVFSTGLVLYQLSAMRDVSGFNQKTQSCDGEKLIRDGLKHLSKSYSNKLVEIIRKMLIFNEEDRPSFVQLGKYIAGDDYVPRVDKSLIAQMNDNLLAKSGNAMIQTAKNFNLKIDEIKNKDFKENIETSQGANLIEEKSKVFLSYISKNHLKYNMNKSTVWFEYAGCLIAKFNIKREESDITKSPQLTSSSNKWKLISKSKFNFPYHCLTIYIDETYGYFIIGGTDGDNTFQFKDGVVSIKAHMTTQRSFMALVAINHFIFAIGGYDYVEKSQLSSIEIYDIEKNIWKRNVIKDLNIPRSQANALVINNHSIFVFGGYSKNIGTLNSIEHINIDSKECDLLDIKLPVPIRRFGLLKISDNKIVLIGGITKLSKKNEDSYIVDLSLGKVEKSIELPQGGVLDHEIILDDTGRVHLFYENNYGTSPPDHVTVNFFELAKLA